MKLIFDNYHFFIWFFLACIPVVLFRVRKLSGKQLTIAQKAGFFLLSLAAVLLWSNTLFFLFDEVPLSFGIKIVALGALSVVIGLLVSLSCYRILCSIQKLARASFFSRNALFFALAGIWGVGLVTHETVADGLSAWHVSSYVANYSYGIASRFLAGSILRLFAGSFVSEKEIYWFCFAVYTLLILLCAALLNWFYRKVPQESKPAALFGIACFVFCPGTINAMWNSGNFGKVDVYGLICSLIGVVIFRKLRRTPLRYLLLTLCACVAIAFYQGYVFLHFSILATVMIEDILRDEDRKEQRKRLCFAALSALVTGACFLYFQFFSSVSFASAEEMLSVLQQHTDVVITKTPIANEYFLPMHETYSLVTSSLHEWNIRVYLFLELILLSPLLFALCYSIIRYNRGNRKLRDLCCGFNLSLLTVLFVVPQFILNVDWGRWMTAAAIDIAFVFAYWLYCGDRRLTEMAEALSEQLRTKMIPYVLLPMYLHMLNLFLVTDVSMNANSLMQFAFRVAVTIKSLF